MKNYNAPKVVCGIFITSLMLSSCTTPEKMAGITPSETRTYALPIKSFSECVAYQVGQNPDICTPQNVAYRPYITQGKASVGCELARTYGGFPIVLFEIRFTQIEENKTSALFVTREIRKDRNNTVKRLLVSVNQCTQAQAPSSVQNLQ